MTDTDWMTTLKGKQDELEEIREYKLKGTLVRARWQQLTEGEKPSKYFLNLENRNFVSKHIRELKTHSKTLVNPTDILKEMKDFYENLYKDRETEDINNTNFAHITNKLTKLDENEKTHIEREISLEDLKQIKVRIIKARGRMDTPMNFTKFSGINSNTFY